MVQPNPWQARSARRPDPSAAAPTPVAPQGIRDLYPRWLRGPLRERPWGYLVAGGASIVCFILLFQTWLYASGPDGVARTDAFGHEHLTTEYLTYWSSHHPSLPRISGEWAIFTSAAAFATVAVAVVYLWFRSELFALGTVVSSAFLSIAVLSTLVHVDSKGPEMKAVLARNTDLGGQVGMVLAWAFGRGPLVIPGTSVVPYTTAALTSSAFAAVALSLGSATLVAAQWAYDHRAAMARFRRPAPPPATGPPPTPNGPPPLPGGPAPSAAAWTGAVQPSYSAARMPSGPPGPARTRPEPAESSRATVPTVRSRPRFGPVMARESSDHH